jgi:hypothetical protein
VSTVWKALCLNHNPAITIDLFDDRCDVKRWERAVELLPGVREQHPDCDLVLGGYSYPLVRVVCPGGEHAAANAPCAHSRPQVFDAETLRLVLAARRANVVTDEHAELFADALANWDRNNRCWTLNRLDRLASELLS